MSTYEEIDKAADLMNARTIIAIDVHDHKLDQARQVGATHLINGRNQDPLSKVLEITGGRGVDYAIESAGRRETMETASGVSVIAVACVCLRATCLTGSKSPLTPLT